MAITRTTELEAVNIMLDVIGEAPINSLNVSGNINIEKAQNCLKEYSVAIQERGWHFNTEEDYELSRDVNSEYPLPTNALKVHTMGSDASVDVVCRGSKLYDRIEHRYTFPDHATLSCRIVFGLEWAELPEHARRYILIAAARAFQERELGSETVHKFTADDEANALLNMIRADTRNRKVNLLTGSWSVLQTINHRRW